MRRYTMLRRRFPRSVFIAECVACLAVAAGIDVVLRASGVIK